MKKFKKVIALLLVVLMSVSIFPIIGSAEDATQSLQRDDGSYAVSKVEESLNLVESILAKIRNAFMSFMCMFERISGQPATVKVMYSMDFYLAQDGDRVVLQNDLTCADVKIDKAINFDLNGHTLTCNTFTLSSEKTANISVKNGTIDAIGGGDVKIATPNATVNLSDLTVKLASKDNQFYVDASMHTINVNANVKVVYIDAETAVEINHPIVVDKDTRVCIAKEVVTPVKIVIAGENVIVENATSAKQDTKLKDGSDNPNAGASVVEIAIVDNEVKDVVITNTSKDEEIPAISISVPDDYENHVDVNSADDCQEPAVIVTNTSGEDVKEITMNGKLEAPADLTAETAADGLSAEIKGLDTEKVYEYRPCYSDEYTAIPAGSASFTTTDKHVFVRVKATLRMYASDDFEVKTGVADATGFTIGCADELNEFSALVSGGNSFKGQTVKLLGNVDLNNEEFTPIGNTSKFFQGTFDGQDYVISNLKITRGINNTDYNNRIGFFRYTRNSTIKNVTFNNASVSGSLYVGVVVGMPFVGDVLQNITLTGHIEVYGYWYCGGIAGNSYSKFINCDIIADDTSKVEITEGYAGGIIGFSGEGSRVVCEDCDSNIDVIGQYNGIGGIIGILHYGNEVKNCTNSGDVINTTYDAGEETPTGGICGTYNQSGKLMPIITNCRFTGTIYHRDQVHANMAHPLYGTPWGNNTYKLIVDGVTINP